ncbi:Uncharacterised protein [Mycobacteroides abscessus subsp. abscessus]|nr:Uncharacterised protein [Mycobacteroides abscessus subsp. abscessus]SIC79044.1 Uncharacterised protein [Mycobacteroides abscessus subsp. abscessus]SKK33081.1 Uncharacterised protein [Mycobacteroides abscessus subsp. abscessus]SKP26863.1 Uncharacterised protein [Mycobacteroides abscessus subsp. abscessus]
MELTWKSYGDTGRVADGNHGKWRVVEGCRAWHLSVEPQFTRGCCHVVSSRTVLLRWRLRKTERTKLKE